MNKVHIESIVACDRDNFGIGYKNTLPWKLPKDMARFKEITLGHSVIMGTQTALSIRRTLPRRTNFVMTRSGSTPFRDQIAITSIQQAVNHAVQNAITNDEDEVKIFVIGGEDIYSHAIPYVTGLHLTLVHGKPSENAPDRFFPYESYHTFYGDHVNTARGKFILDGEPDDSIITTYEHIRFFNKKPGPPLIHLPEGWELA